MNEVNDIKSAIQDIYEFLNSCEEVTIENGGTKVSFLILDSGNLSDIETSLGHIEADIGFIEGELKNE